jgi:recombinational DNA repair protein (RecF pathway)
MSIFKSQWIVLKIKKISEKNLLYTILTSDYGKILCNKKFNSREKNLDLGFLINFEIEVKLGINIHSIKNIKILDEFDFLWKKYSTINNLLILLNIINLKLPEKLVNLEIFNSLKNIIKYKKLTPNKLILSQLKIINILWLLDLENKNLTIKKILYFINKNKIENILKLTWIDQKLELELKSIVNKY